MSLAAWIISGLLLLVLGAVAYTCVMIHKKVRLLTDRRVDLYVAQLNEINQEMRALRKDRPIPKPDGKIAAEMNIIASFPTMRQASDVRNAMIVIAKKRRNRAPNTEVEAAIQLAEKELVALTVAMREDFALNVSNGRFQNSEVFRVRRDEMQA